MHHVEVIGVTGLELIVIGTGGMPQVFDVPHQVAAAGIAERIVFSVSEIYLFSVTAPITR